MSSFFFEHLKIMCRSIPAILKNRRRPSELCRTKISESTGFSYQSMLGIKKSSYGSFFNSTIGGIFFLLSVFMNLFTTTSFFIQSFHLFLTVYLIMSPIIKPFSGTVLYTNEFPLRHPRECPWQQYFRPCLRRRDRDQLHNPQS